MSPVYFLGIIFILSALIVMRELCSNNGTWMLCSENTEKYRFWFVVLYRLRCCFISILLNVESNGKVFCIKKVFGMIFIPEVQLTPDLFFPLHSWLSSHSLRYNSSSLVMVFKWTNKLCVFCELHYCLWCYWEEICE